MADVKVEMVKLGDVLFYLDSKIEMLLKFMQDDEKSEVEYMMKQEKNLANWCQGRIDARKSDIKTLIDIRNEITKLK